MPARILSLLPGLMCCAMMAACSDPLTHPPAMPARERSWSEQLLQQLNAYRGSRGLKELKPHPGLTRLSLSHCDWLREKQGSSFKLGTHVSHFGSHWRQQTARRQYQMEAWGENVAYTAHLPEDVAHHILLLWQTSPSHQPLLVGDWTHAGMALRVDKGQAIFATLTFGRLRPDADPP